MREHQVGEQTDVRVHRHPSAVERLGRQGLDALELAVEGAVLARDAVVLARHVGGGVDVDDARVAVDDQLIALVYGLDQVLDADDGRDFEGFGENRGV